MATSGPYGSDRLGTSLTSFTSAPVRYCHAISTPEPARSPLKLARGLLYVYPAHRLWDAVRSAAFTWAKGVLGVRGPYGEDHTDHLQQKLLVLVAARLAAREILRAGIRGGRHRPRRCVGAGRNPAAVVIDPGAVPAPRRRHRLGHAGDWRIPQRGDAGCRPVAGGPGPARPLPVDLRRNPFRFHDAARLAAGQPEGPFPRLQDLVARPGRYRPGLHHLARMPCRIRRAIPVWRTHHGRRDVCARGDALHDL